MANQTINVNYTPGLFQPTLYYSQDDVGRVFQINLEGFEIPSGATVTIQATKPSGLGFTVAADSVDGNVATFTTTSVMTDESGRFPAELHIVSGNIEVGTANFLMVGERNPHPSGTTDGSQGTIIPELTLLVERVEAAADSIHNLSVTATTLPAGSDATASFDDETDTLSLGIPRGADGDVTREEFNDLKSDLYSFTNDGYKEITDIAIDWQTGGYYRISDGVFVTNEAYSYAEITLDSTKKYIHFIGTPLYYACGLIFMNGNTKVGDSIPSTSSTAPIDGNYKIPVGASSIRISKLDQECFLAYSEKILELKDNTVEHSMFGENLQDAFVVGEYTEQTIIWGNSKQYINCNNGVISDATQDVHVSDYIDCSNVKAIRLTASPYYSFACMAFYDATKNFISSYPSSSSNVNYWMEEIAVPDNAKFVVFGNNSAMSGKLAVKVEFMESYATLLNRKWYGKKWACVGDSLTEVNDRSSMRYMDYIQIETGIRPYNIGKSGTGYANRHAQSEAFYDRISNVPSDSDVVTIFGSFNDVFSSSPLEIGTITDSVSDNTLCGFINGTIDKLYNNFPTAQLGIITPCPWENANPSNTNSRASQYVQAIVDICKSRGIACLDLFHCSGMRPWESGYRAIYYTHDDGSGVHPNELGHKIIASHINAFLSTILI